MPLFSIIIPCYNHFALMKKCLESLEKQTCQDFEAILIDDASQDDMLENLYAYQKQTVLHMTILENKENLGPGASRNRGIEMTKGKYVIFLDADDYLDIHTLAILQEQIEKEKPDCIIFDYYFETTHHQFIPQKSYLKNETGSITKEDAFVHSTGSTCCKVYLLDILKQNKVMFPAIKRCEDMVFNKTAMACCEKIIYLPQNLYYYVLQEKSIMHTEETLSIENSKKAVEIIETNLKEKYPKETEALFLKEYFYGILITLVKLKKSNEEIKLHIEDCERKYPQIYQNPVIPYMTKFQQICVKLAQTKHIFLLKWVIKCKEELKKNL